MTKTEALAIREEHREALREVQKIINGFRAEERRVQREAKAAIVKTQCTAEFIWSNGKPYTCHHPAKYGDRCGKHRNQVGIVDRRTADRFDLQRSFQRQDRLAF